VVAVAGDPQHSQVFYFGSTGGGVWKTSDGGIYWENVSDGFFKRASVGAIAVAPSDANVIYVGMGEATIRGNVSHGDGVYKSSDGGKTWSHLGLQDTRNIGKVRVHPHNPDIVYVAALGHAHGANKERGIFRSRDGGTSWEQVLFRNEDVGCHDLVIDPNNPRIIYAALWRARRLPYALQSGGEGCALLKSTDGGDTWVDLTRNPGLPTGTIGKIGVTVSGAKEDRVWAIIEAEDGALFRSDDGGATWQRGSEESDLRKRPWYYMHIIADPQDAETVWVLNEDCLRSTDGGKTFNKIATPHGDHHDLWIDPQDTQRIILGSDGGGCISFNGSDSWSSIYNQPTAEFYHVTADTQVPYRLYGAQQDNSTITIPSRSQNSAITIADAYEIGGGESSYIAVRPDNNNIIFAGSYLGYLTRYDHRTSQTRDISVWPDAALGWPARDARYRFQWTFPILLSPHDPNVLYVTGNHVFRSTDEGESWEEISPDLTRNDPSKMENSGGPITVDNVGTEYYGTVFAFAESALERGLFWAGSDDGLVHLSRDGGKSWQNVTPRGLPEWTLISMIEPSPHDPATAYLAATRYKLDDFQPYLYKTNDYGDSWTKITQGMGDDDFTRVIREDPVRRGLLFAGTETGVHVSFDDGEQWHSLRTNLPVVPIHDLIIKDSDLIAATHGRSFWILDDISALRQFSEEVRSSTAHVFASAAAERFATSWDFGQPVGSGKNFKYSGVLVLAYKQKEKPNGEKVTRYLDAGQNPPDGAVIRYYLKEKPEGAITLTIFDAEGKEIKTFSSEEKKKEPANLVGVEKKEKSEEKKEPRLTKEIGINRFLWDTRYANGTSMQGDKESEGLVEGPLALTGVYRLQLNVGDQSFSGELEIRLDPRVGVAQEDLRARFELLIAIRDRLSEAHRTINTIRDLRRQIDAWGSRTKGRDIHKAVVQKGEEIKKKLTLIEEALTQVKSKNQMDTMDYPMRINGKLASLAGTVASADSRPTQQSQQVFEELAANVERRMQQLREIVESDLAEFNKMMREADVPAVIPQATQAGTAGTVD
jgi:photosystem II stability/assembly factor-like uncharacterized protein